MINIKSNHDILYKSDRYFNAKLIIIFHPYFWFQNLNFFVIDLTAKIIIIKKNRDLITKTERWTNKFIGQKTNYHYHHHYYQHYSATYLKRAQWQSSNKNDFPSFGPKKKIQKMRDH